MSKKKNRKKELLMELENFAEPARDAHSDVQGSWTGNPLYDAQPVQDADDL